MPQVERNVLLVVDDEPDFLEIIEHVGTGVGFEVLTAASADAFFGHLAHRRPSVVLLDLQLPGMDGVEVLRNLAHRSVEAGVLLVSGMDHRVLMSARQLGESLGLRMLGVLQKPAMLPDIEAALEKHVDDSARLVAGDVRQALREQAFVVHYQPQLGRTDGTWRITGAEAQVRWPHPRLGLLLPGQFLPPAGDSDLVAGIADFVLAESIRQAGEWQRQGMALRLAVNVLPQHLRDGGFPDRLHSLLRESGLPPEQLVIEVGEAASFHDTDPTDVFTRLRVRGIGLALDEFGAGLASLAPLYRLPWTAIKVDAALLQEALRNPAAATVVTTLVELAHRLSFAACAGGIDSVAGFDFAVQAGCDGLQGGLIAPAVPAAELASLVTSWREGFPVP